MFKRYECGMRPAPKAFAESECGIGENPKSGIPGKRLGCRVLRRLRRNRNTRQILESEGEVTARQEPRPTGRAPVLRSSLATEGGKLPLSPIQSPVIVSLGQTSWADKLGGPAAGLFRCKIKCITVIHLIRGCAVTTCAFHDALLERWTGGNTTQYIQPQTITSNQVKYLTVRHLKKVETLCHVSEKSGGYLRISASNLTAVSRM